MSRTTSPEAPARRVDRTTSPTSSSGCPPDRRRWRAIPTGCTGSAVCIPALTGSAAHAEPPGVAVPCPGHGSWGPTPHLDLGVFVRGVLRGSVRPHQIPHRSLATASEAWLVWHHGAWHRLPASPAGRGVALAFVSEHVASVWTRGCSRVTFRHRAAPVCWASRWGWRPLHRHSGERDSSLYMSFWVTTLRIHQLTKS